jgi:hypothetical protein
MFLRETLAAAAGVKRGNLSIAKLGEIAAHKRYCDIDDSLRSFFDSLTPYKLFGDFQFRAKLPRPRPLQLHVEPYTFYGHFRGWLRKRGPQKESNVSVRFLQTRQTSKSTCHR